MEERRKNRCTNAMPNITIAIRRGDQMMKVQNLKHYMVQSFKKCGKIMRKDKEWFYQYELPKHSSPESYRGEKEKKKMDGQK